MSARTRFLIAVIALGLLVSGPFSLTALVVWADMQGPERELLANLMLPRLPLGALFTIIAFIIGIVVIRTLFRQYVQGLLRMAEQLRLMLGANRNFRVATEGPPEVQLLATAANDLAQQRDDLLTDVEAQIAVAKASVEEEKNRLAALMSELSQSVVVCNLDGRILLYNTRARLQFKALAQGPTAAAGSGALIGLGRSIFAIFERNQIAHALDNITQRLARGGAEPVANFVTTTPAGQLLRIQMAPVLASPAAAEGATATPPRQIAGYVLTMENITRAFEQESRRDQMLSSLTEGGRSALASIRAAVENLIDYPDMESEQRERFVRIIGDEAKSMSLRLDQTMNQFADSLKTRWPLEEMLGADLVAAVERRVAARLKLPTKNEELAEGLWVKVDSFSLIQALTFLAAKLQDDYEVREVRFRLSSEGRLAYFDLIWQGPPVSSETIHSWEMEPMNVAGETTPLTLRDVTERHGGEIWFQREKPKHRAFFRIVVPVANPQEAPAAEPAERSDSRPEYYDFDLFNFTETSAELLDRKLSELVYTVFDTETTGLLPSDGDEIIQIGATRIVNGRMLSGEVIDQLVDPQRPLRPESVHIHGITEDMLQGQPTIDRVLPVFQQFAAETVLVAHNAAFDMRFLQLKEESTGIRFGQPVLDTLLLSAVVHPNQETHKLEAIAARLGIDVIGRHTALGDAFVTAEVFLKMVPLLAEKGITTLRDALAASEKTYMARVKY